MSKHYIRAEILLPRGDEMVRGHVVAQSCITNRNYKVLAKFSLSATIFNSISNIEIRNYDCCISDLSVFVDTTHVTIKQKDHVLVVYSHHHVTMMHISLYTVLPTSTLPTTHSIHSHLPLLLEASTHVPQI